jgi:hypothetical protein
MTGYRKVASLRRSRYESLSVGEVFLSRVAGLKIAAVAVNHHPNPSTQLKLRPQVNDVKANV